MLPRGRAFQLAQRAVSLRIQSNLFKLFALHLPLLLAFKLRFTLPPLPAAEHPATSPVSPAAGPSRGASAIVSSRSGTRSFLLLPHNSSLPTRTAPRPREIPPATPARPLYVLHALP